MSRDNYSIVCIDDCTDDLVFLKSSLEEYFVLKTFENASDAMIYLENNEPDLIISDVIMPNIDGFSFYDNYRAFFPYRTTPIIFLSSISDPEQISSSIDKGVYDFITKPVNPKVLISKIKAILKREADKNAKNKKLHFIKAQGKISTIKLKDKLITIQTEILSRGIMETIVTLEGQILKKVSKDIKDLDEDEISKFVENQHLEVENEIKEKLLALKKESESYSELFEKGLEKYREKNYSEAYQIWSHALKLYPEDKILKVNLEIVEKKLKESEKKI